LSLSVVVIAAAAAAVGYCCFCLFVVVFGVIWFVYYCSLVSLVMYFILFSCQPVFLNNFSACLFLFGLSEIFKVSGL